MNYIGLRVEPKTVTFAVYELEENAITNIEKLNVPLALETPEQLKFIRSNILDIFREFQISRVGIKITEPNSQHLNISRLQIEGVIQEAIASSQVDYYYTGQISTISSKLQFPRTDFKKYITNELNYDNVENWAELSSVEKEAVFAALGAAI
ncbi:MAG: hypothetical protein DSZ27_02605 [Thiomicrospira sp.]|nr:MAG: hypothetical protein DSZ27_02605 [Thiomicrospira sp.]